MKMCLFSTNREDKGRLKKRFCQSPVSWASKFLRVILGSWVTLREQHQWENTYPLLMTRKYLPLESIILGTINRPDYMSYSVEKCSCYNSVLISGLEEKLHLRITCYKFLQWLFTNMYIIVRNTALIIVFCVL